MHQQNPDHQQNPYKLQQNPVSSIHQQYLYADFNNSLQSSPNLEVDMVNSKILDRSSKARRRGLRMNFSSKESLSAAPLGSATT